MEFFFEKNVNGTTLSHFSSNSTESTFLGVKDCEIVQFQYWRFSVKTPTPVFEILKFWKSVEIFNFYLPHMEYEGSIGLVSIFMFYRTFDE
jgi:hypothetical protein